MLRGHGPRGTQHAARNTAQLALALALLHLVAASLRATNLPPATVSFLDGSFLRGEIDSLTSDTLKWRHPNARQPIEFTTTNLNLIRLPARSMVLPTNAAPVCRIQLASGDEFEGLLLSLDGETFEVETWFAGRLRGQRAGLTSLSFYGNSQTALYDGPRAAEDWKVSNGSMVINRVAGDFGGANFVIRQPAVALPQPAMRIPPPPAVNPQELVAKLKDQIEKLGDKTPAVVKQALEKAMKDAEGLAGKPGGNDNVARQVARRSFTVEELARLSDDAEKSATVAELLKSDLVKEALKEGQTSEAAIETWFADFKDPNAWVKNDTKVARFKVMLRAEVDVLVRRLQGRAAPFVEVVPAEPLPLPIPPPQLEPRPMRIAPPAQQNQVVPPPAPAVDPVAQAVRIEIQRRVEGGVVRAGELPVLPPVDLKPVAPAAKAKPTPFDITRMSSTARFSMTIAEYLKSELVLLAVESGLVKADAVKADLDKQVAAGSEARTLIRREGALLAARLLRELEHMKNEPAAATLARTQDLLGGIRPDPAVPAPAIVALPGRGAELAPQIQAMTEVNQKVTAAIQLGTVADFLKSDLLQAAVTESVASQRAQEDSLTRYERSLEGVNEQLRASQLKLVLQGEALLLGIRLLAAKAPAVAPVAIRTYEQSRAQVQATLAQFVEAREAGKAAADVLALARERALGAMQLPANNLNIALPPNAEAVFAGRAAVAGAAAAGASWVFRDGAYYSSAVGTLGRECNLPTKARIEFELAWKGQPNVRFSFFTRSTDHFDYNDGWQFYTSSSGYIYMMRRTGVGATTSISARVPQMLTKNSVRLTFLVNTETETTVLLADGERVHEWKSLGSPGSGTGIVFHTFNSTSRVRVGDIRIAPWDGRERMADPFGAPGDDPDKIVEVPPADSAVVEFVNRDRATGTLHGIRDGKLTFNPAGAKLEIPLTRAAMIAFPVNATPALPVGDGVQVTLHRSERLTLALEKWDGSEIIAVSPVFGRLKLKPEAIRTLRFNPTATRGTTDEWGGP